MTPARPARLVADLAVDPPLQFVLGPGEALLLDHPQADAVVAALVGWDRRGHRVLLDGRNLSRRRPATRVRRGLAVVSGTPVAPDVSVLDHLAATAGRTRGAALLASAPLLAGRGDDPAGVLSGGERRVLGWLRALAANPRAVVLDRAGEGLDPESLALVGGIAADWRARGVSLVVRPGRTEERSWCEPGPSPDD